MGRDTSSEPIDSPTLTSARGVSERKFGKVAPLGFSHAGVQPFQGFVRGICNPRRSKTTLSLYPIPQYNSIDTTRLPRKPAHKPAKAVSYLIIRIASRRIAVAPPCSTGADE